MDYNDLRWEHLDKQKLLVGISSFTMWLRAMVYPFGVGASNPTLLKKGGVMAFSVLGCIPLKYDSIRKPFYQNFVL